MVAEAEDIYMFVRTEIIWLVADLPFLYVDF